MRTTLTFLSSAFLVLSQSGLVSSAVAKPQRAERRNYVCTDDDFYNGLWDNPAIYTDVTQTCSEVLGVRDVTSCIDYTTPVT